MDQWLIRTAQNWIAGPYTKDQVRKMVLEGQLTLQDEVCSGNGYWVYLHERDEVLKQLGVEVPKSPGHAEEITETQTQTGDEDHEETDPALEADSSAQTREQDTEAGTTVLKSRPRAEFSITTGATIAPVSATSVVGTTVGPGALWRTRGWLLIAGLCLLIFLVLRLIRD